jgi:hypothetical protein
MKAWLKRFQAVLLAGSLLGCTGEPMRIDPIADTGSLDLSKGRKIVAAASGFHLFNSLPTNASSRHARAFQALRDQAPDEAIADVTIRESWYYAIFGTFYTTTLEATAYPRKRW